MENMWKENFKNKWVLALGLVALSFVMVNCSSKTNNAAATAAATGYVTCPATGYYTNSYGTATACTPGTTVYTVAATTATTGVTNGYQICPAVGYYVSNGMTYGCTVGSSVYVGSTTSTVTSSNPCAQYTAQYGVLYQPNYVNGQYMCVRY